MLRLSEPFRDFEANCSPQHDTTLRAIQPLIDQLPVRVLRNPYQLSLVPTKPLDLDNLRRTVVESLSDIVFPSQVQQSGHSVDVLHTRNSKAETPRAIERILGIGNDDVLRIGDLGNWGGNDFDLLNEGLSLSVDRISSKLDTCWNLGPPGSKGITTTMRYLLALAS